MWYLPLHVYISMQHTGRNAISLWKLNKCSLSFIKLSF